MTVKDRLNSVADDIEHFVLADDELTFAMPVKRHDIAAFVDLARLLARGLDTTFAEHFDNAGPGVRYDVCARALKGMRTQR